MGIFYKCPLCGNEDIRYIGFRHGKPYCRKCVAFKNNSEPQKNTFPKNASIVLNYELSEEQKNLSDQILDNYKNGKNSLIHAVCGSGKTEIVLGVISYAVKCGERVAFCIPRRDVVIEIHDRLKEIFKWNKVVAVYGGNTDKLEGDIIVLTAHQLFRYQGYFHLIILDEIDAFPFAGNDLLDSFFKRACIGNYVMMSATPSDTVINEFKKSGGQILSLNNRFHRHLLPVPEIVVHKKPFYYSALFSYVSQFIKETKQVFIFAPTIEICENLFTILKIKFQNGNCVHSKKPDRAQIIQDFKCKKYMYLVTTAVLERGVTVKDLQVIVFLANHNVYKTHTLVQIAGRSGRKKDAPEGRVIFICEKITKEIENSINQIEHANKDLQNMF